VAETIIKRLLGCGFRRTGKAMGQMYQCWWRMSRNKMFSRFKYHLLRFISISDLFADSLSYYDVGVMECVLGESDILCRRYFSWE
jgi:hypothetical protein